jgi:hypothetical protein
MTGYALALVLAVALVALLFALLRRRRLREKYAGIWIALAVVVAVFGAFPRLAFRLADLVGVETPVNLLFTLGFAVLLAVALQLSSEVSGLEEETRTVAEELALLRAEVEQLRRADGDGRAARSQPQD